MAATSKIPDEIIEISDEGDDNKPPFSDEEERLEREHLKKIINAFLFYKVFSFRKIHKSWHDFADLPQSHKSMLSTYPGHLNSVRKAVETNYQFIFQIISNAVGFFENSDISEFTMSDVAGTIAEASPMDMTKVITTLKQFYRDWSSEGAAERDKCYTPIVDKIKERFPPEQCDVSSVRVLVPGSGLGRLAYDVAYHGYFCQGNEFSMFMLLASNFILNRCENVKEHTIHPWVLQSCNNVSYADQLATILVPDINPSDLPQRGLFSMAAGDFLEVYTEPDYWDCVACCFFIDTAHNIVSYLEKIYEILKPGGVWINFGPLLYHFADIPNEKSIELSWEEVKRIALEIGFKIEMEQFNCSSPYIQNPKSLLHLTYQCVFLVATKPLPLQPTQ